MSSETPSPPQTVPLATVGVAIPTYNARNNWAKLVSGLRQQRMKASQVLIIDSESTDGTAELAMAEGFQVHRIRHIEFNHGATRQLAVNLLPWATILVYLTQDAILTGPDVIDRLLSVFDDSTIAAAYGRQLPRAGANGIEAHARLFNYPAQSGIRNYESRKTLGIKAAFLSNSFSAFRVNALCAAGGFPADVIMAEDALVAGRLLLAGFRIAYVSEATVYHSHAYTPWNEFRRYFDTGVYHSRESWLLEQFGAPRREGRRFFISELKYLASNEPWRLPEALFRSLLKVAGYQLGLRESSLGSRLSRVFSLHRNYWKHEAEDKAGQRLLSERNFIAIAYNRLRRFVLRGKQPPSFYPK